MHCSLFLRHSAKDVWIYLDDSILKEEIGSLRMVKKKFETGKRWDEVKDEVIRAHQQPCMVVYVSSNASPNEICSAPKNVEVDFEKLQQLRRSRNQIHKTN